MSRAKFRYLMHEWFPQRESTLIGITAAALSRSYLVPASIALSWSRPRGEVRAAGRAFTIFYAASSLMWGGIALLACLYIRSLNGLIASRIDPAAPLFRGTVAEEIPIYGGIVRSISGPLGWLHCLIWTVLALTLFGVRKWWTRLEENLNIIGCILYKVLTVLCQYVAMIVCFFMTISVLCAAFPGLLESSIPSSRFPWWVWFSIASGLQVYRGASPLNPRIREYSTDLFDVDSYPYVPTTLRALVNLLAVIFWHFPREVGRSRTWPSLARLVNSHLEIKEPETRELEYFLICRAFFEREGLHSLVSDQDNPERRFYALRQREAFDAAYTKLAVKIAECEWQIQWVQGSGRDASPNSVAISESNEDDGHFPLIEIESSEPPSTASEPAHS